MSKMFEILVPTLRNDGKPFRTRYHRVWDQKVREISGGLTIFQPVKGQWISKEGQLFTERMIPVRIICSDEQIMNIIRFTMKYYDQLAILAYEISNNVLLIHKDQI
jgi:hypothetical protein